MDNRRCVSAMTETIGDIDLLIHSVCRRFCRQKGIPPRDYDEWCGEAYLASVEAYYRYRPNRSTKFSTWAWNCIWRALLEKYRNEAPHRETRRLDAKLVDKRSEPSYHDPIRLDLSALSMDAKTVVEAVMTLAGHVDGKERGAADVRAALQNLLVNMGWSWKRIVESFAEIRRALQ